MATKILCAECGAPFLGYRCTGCGNVVADQDILPNLEPDEILVLDADGFLCTATR